MDLWQTICDCLAPLRSACARRQTFFWMCLFIFGIMARDGDLAGVTSIVRTLGLIPGSYNRLLDFLHSASLDVEALQQLWVSLVFRIFLHPLWVNGRFVIVCDGIKAPKEGKKMPGVKSLHQESDSNSKPEYIMGHSCQAIALLVHAVTSVFAVPLACRIHEGVVSSNRDHKTLLDKVLLLLSGLHIPKHYYLLADAYYGSQKIIHGLVNAGNHLITRMKSNAVAYYPPEPPTRRRRGRPQQYGRKIKLKTLFDDLSVFTQMESPTYGDTCSIRVRTIDLLWRSAGRCVRFVLVIHPHRGKVILMSTDCSLDPLELIRLYGLRFKIEITFKQSVHTVGTFSYHLWMKLMDPIRRRSGNQYLHRKTSQYRKQVKRKLAAYHRYILLSLIAHGLLQYLSCTKTASVWTSFRSFIRTIRPGIPPSEAVVSKALRTNVFEFLRDGVSDPIFEKFIRKRIDISRIKGALMIA